MQEPKVPPLNLPLLEDHSPAALSSSSPSTSGSATPSPASSIASPQSPTSKGGGDPTLTLLPVLLRRLQDTLQDASHFKEGIGWRTVIPILLI